ncbi:hypothetical protein [Alcanivorax sp. DP30]|nr:hypothetical protein [Alcanivorax sp. DP30]MZR62334.1 hypothetical protein [Alcanivorax sp. DP30]
MIITMNEMLNALATLLGGNRYNHYLETRHPAPVPIHAERPGHPEHH